ncbi:GNAT family N-acetyltransferase [Vallitalea sp.]|uniref:GNAT family N-acetyltransferase n=1 Tax=Vallitalea sp. TaxID=1882829 RepID=UPI0025D50345|nr:GNAT family N-acetyltransferase [Vallitalea sp.]MCT4687439.1 GNAT family N-acetyltransferase [Vallitalea sp.]
MKKYPILETQQFKFREIKRNDYNLIKKWYKNSEAESLSNKSIKRISPRKWYKYYKNDYDLLIYIIEEKNIYCIPIGTVILRVIDENTVELGGYVIGESSAKKQGYGIKVMNLIQKIIFSKLGCRYSYLKVNCSNRPAVETYIKCGYKINSFIEKKNQDMYIMRAVNRTCTQ